MSTNEKIKDFLHELIIPSDDLPFKLFPFEGSKGNYIREKHWHRSVEVFAVFKGKVRFFVREQEFALTAGNFIMMNSNEIHSIFAKNPNETVVLQIPLSAFQEFYTEDKFIRFAQNPAVKDEELMKLIFEMYQIYGERKYGYQLEVQSKFYRIMYILVNQYRKEIVSQEELRYNQKLNRLSVITSYIQDNYQKELSLEGLADIFGYSSSYLSRMFQKYAQMNYKDYLQSVRLGYAYSAIENTTETLSNIAITHGFPNSKAMAKAFKKKYGILPGEFRKSQKSDIK